MWRQEQAADKFRYIMWGSFDEPGLFPPKGEFFCKNRAEWMPEVQGELVRLFTSLNSG